MISFFFSSRITMPPIVNTSQHKPGFRALLSDSVAMLRDVPAFGRFVLATFVFNCGIWMATPLFSVVPGKGHARQRFFDWADQYRQ
jgi:hypothetical protein